jgi:hypothetical protein
MLLWSHFVVLLKSDLDVQQTHLRLFFNTVVFCSTSKSDLSITTKCDQNNILDSYEFGHTCVTRFITMFVMNLVTSKAAANYLAFVQQIGF